MSRSFLEAASLLCLNNCFVEIESACTLSKVVLSCADSRWYHLFLFFLPPGIRVTAEVKHNPTNTIVCKAQGEWNGTLEFTYSNGDTKVIDTTKLPVIRKKIRPIANQGPLESR